MAYNTRALKLDVNSKPIPQYYNANVDDYEVLQGQNGAARALLYGPDGSPINATGGRLAVQASELDITLSALRDALRGIDSKTLSDLAGLLTAIRDTAGVKRIVDPVDVSDRSARQLGQVTLSGSLPPGSNVIGRVDTERDRSSLAFKIPLGAQATGVAVYGSNVLLCVDGAFLYESNDNGETFVPVPSVNNDGVANVDRRVFLVRFDKLTGDAYVVGRYKVSETNYLAVWVRKAGESSFTRTILSEVVTSNLPASLSVGKMGVFVCTRGSYIVWRSADKGTTWSSFTFDSTYFSVHVHSVWASPFESFVYVTGGDNFTDGTGGCYRSSDFTNWTKVYTEVAGLRVVPVTGTHRQRFLGVEAQGGGILTSFDDANWIMVGERDLLSWANFQSLHVTDDGILVMGTYQSQTTYPQDRYGHGGVIWISADGGRTGVSIPLPYHDVADIDSNSDYIFIACGYAATGLYNGKYLLRIRKPNRFNMVTKDKVTRFFVNEQMTGAVIDAGASTIMIDAVGYKDAVLFIDSQPGTWTLQGAPYIPAFGSTVDNNNVWLDIKQLTYSVRTKELVTLPAGAEKLSLYRLVNTGASNTRIYAAGMILTK